MNSFPADKPPAITRGVAVVGSTTVDLNVIAAERFIKPGGVTAYAGITYRRLGATTWVVTNVAPEDKALLAALEREGLGLIVEDSRATTRFVNRVVDGRRTQEMPAAADPVRTPQVLKALDRADCVHLGPLHPRDIDPRVFPILKGSGALIVLDAQGYARGVEDGRVRPAVSERLGPALEAADIVKTNQDEFETIRRFHALPLPRLMSDFGILEWVVTRGPEGGRVIDSQGKEHRYKAVPVRRRVDPTGAGDVFLAAYVAARFADRMPVAAACESAARLASEQLAGRFINLSGLDRAGRSHFP